jgi:hypothetical protein
MSSFSPVSSGSFRIIERNGVVDKNTSREQQNIQPVSQKYSVERDGTIKICVKYRILGSNNKPIKEKNGQDKIETETRTFHLKKGGDEVHNQETVQKMMEVSMAVLQKMVIDIRKQAQESYDSGSHAVTLPPRNPLKVVISENGAFDVFRLSAGPGGDQQTSVAVGSLGTNTNEMKKVLQEYKQYLPCRAVLDKLPKPVPPTIQLAALHQYFQDNKGPLAHPDNVGLRRALFEEVRRVREQCESGKPNLEVAAKDQKKVEDYTASVTTQLQGHLKATSTARETPFLANDQGLLESIIADPHAFHPLQALGTLIERDTIYSEQIQEPKKSEFQLIYANLNGKLDQCRYGSELWFQLEPAEIKNAVSNLEAMMTCMESLARLWQITLSKEVWTDIEMGEPRAAASPEVPQALEPLQAPPSSATAAKQQEQLAAARAVTTPELTAPLREINPQRPEQLSAVQANAGSQSKPAQQLQSGGQNLQQKRMVATPESSLQAPTNEAITNARQAAEPLPPSDIPVAPALEQNVEQGNKNQPPSLDVQRPVEEPSASQPAKGATVKVNTDELAKNIQNNLKKSDGEIQKILTQKMLKSRSVDAVVQDIQSGNEQVINDAHAWMACGEALNKAEKDYAKAFTEQNAIEPARPALVTAKELSDSINKIALASDAAPEVLRKAVTTYIKTLTAWQAKLADLGQKAFTAAKQAQIVARRGPIQGRGPQKELTEISSLEEISKIPDETLRARALRNLQVPLPKTLKDLTQLDTQQKEMEAKVIKETNVALQGIIKKKKEAEVKKAQEEQQDMKRALDVDKQKKDIQHEYSGALTLIKELAQRIRLGKFDQGAQEAVNDYLSAKTKEIENSRDSKLPANELLQDAPTRITQAQKENQQFLDAHNQLNDEQIVEKAWEFVLEQRKNMVKSLKEGLPKGSQAETLGKDLDTMLNTDTMSVTKSKILRRANVNMQSNPNLAKKVIYDHYIRELEALKPPIQQAAVPIKSTPAQGRSSPKQKAALELQQHKDSNEGAINKLYSDYTEMYKQAKDTAGEKWTDEQESAAIQLYMQTRIDKGPERAADPREQQNIKGFNKALQNLHTAVKKEKDNLQLFLDPDTFRKSLWFKDIMQTYNEKQGEDWDENDA